jgi:hypothetical protein
MKEALVKLEPYAFGLVLGWFLVNPPDFVMVLGPARHLLTVALVLLALLAFTGAQVLANLPENVDLLPVPTAAPDVPVRALTDQLQALGFAPAGPPLRVGVRPPALLWPFVHEGEGAYATVYRTGTVPAKVAFDVVTIFDGARGGLTSGAEPAGAALPASPGSLRQVFPGAGPQEVFAAHQKALAYVRGRGIKPKAPSASAFPTEFRESFARQRRAFLARPMINSALMLWRAATQTTPHIGPIQNQPHAQAVIRDLQTGRRA